MGIHNRQGDFNSNINKQIGHVASSADYFQAAVTQSRRKHYFDSKSVLFLVVGDDYKWNREIFATFPDVVVMRSEEAIDDLCLLATCDELILSASSFSWWAGYLNGGPVIASALYALKNSELASQMSRDYYLPSWTLL